MTTQNKEQPTETISVFQIFKFFRKETVPQKTRFFIYTFLFLISATLSVLVPKVYSQIATIATNTELLDSEIAKQLGTVILFVGFLLMIQTIFSVIIRWLYRKVTMEIRTNLRDKIPEYLLNHSYTFFANHFSGSVFSQTKKGIKAHHKFLYAIQKTFNFLFFFIGIIVIAFQKNLYMGIAFLVFAVGYCLIAYLCYKTETKYEVKRNELQSKSSGILSDILGNSMNVLTFHSQKKEVQAYEQSLQKRSDANYQRDVKHNINRLWCEGFECICVLGVMFLSLKYREMGIFDAAMIIMFYTYVRALGRRLEIVSLLQTVNTIYGDSVEMFRILNTPHEIVDKSEKKLKVWAGKVEFQDLTFGYSNEVKVFEHFDLRIKPGEKVALVWQSGSGKSTLTKLLFRFYDLFEGKITIDDQDISEVTQESLRSQISLVPQEVILFHRSLRENICYGNLKATEEEMIAACKMARCHDFISKLEQGYDTLVGERGIKLSWGERQRVAIARAILENKKILVLDEATSALDSESEVLIQEAMEEVMKNKTCIVIAHRLSTIRKMDKIVVMEKGKIIEKGSHNELLNLNGTYAKLWNLQSDGFLGEE